MRTNTSELLDDLKGAWYNKETEEEKTLCLDQVISLKHFPASQEEQKHIESNTKIP